MFDYQQPDASGHFGRYGGSFASETLTFALQELKDAYARYQRDPDFLAEFAYELNHFVGRPSPVYHAARTSQELGGAQIYLKREDLNHTGAHKINNVIGQAMLAKRMGKPRIIAETGAGQHGVATATICARYGLECVVYMGSEDVKRQSPNVYRMKLLGATVVPVDSGSRTLKDALNEAMRDWVANVDNTFYIIGTVAGPHPYPMMVRDFQSVIGTECLAQMPAMLAEQKIAAEQPDAEHDAADQEEFQNVPVPRGLHALDQAADDQALDDDDDVDDDRRDRDDHACHRENLQRHEREAGDQVEVEPDQPVQRVLRFAGSAFFMQHVDFGRSVRERVGKRGDERAHLVRRCDRVDDVAAVRAQHAPLVGHANSGDPFAQPVHQPRCIAAPPRILAGATHAADVIGAGVHRCEQLADFLRRILQVGVERHDPCSAHALESGQDGEVLPVVAVEVDDARFVGSARELLAQQCARPIPAAVVDENHLVGDLQRIERRVEAREQRGQPRLLVVDGDDDGKRRRGHRQQRVTFTARVPRREPRRTRRIRGRRHRRSSRRAAAA